MPAETERRPIDLPAKSAIRAHYDAIAPGRAAFRRRNNYYHNDVLRYLRFVVPEGARVLDIGCGDGALLRGLRPSRGLGIDFSSQMIAEAVASATHTADANVEFRVADIEATRFDETFDFVVLSDVLGNLVDIQAALENARTACRADTRVILNYHSILWEPVLKVGEMLGYKMPQPHHNWLSQEDIETFIALCDFELVKFARRLLFPISVPGLSFVLNRLVAPLPFLNRLCLSDFAVLRMKARAPARDATVTVVIPCRNEMGNIRPALQRLPAFGTHQEIIFVDGHSTDGTLEEIRAAAADNPHRDIKAFKQEGRGKADAVRLAFEHASGEILMILDADLTVPPEDLPRFYDALVRDKGGFINGSRMIYPMERQAMRFLNILGNKFFSYAFSWLLSQRLKDTLCGTKVLYKRDYERIVAGRSYFGDFDPFGDFDLLFGAAKLNLKIAELPVRYRERTYGTTNIARFRHGLLLLRMVLFALRKLKV